jgi:hypothetical protein
MEGKEPAGKIAGNRINAHTQRDDERMSFVSTLAV